MAGTAQVGIGTTSPGATLDVTATNLMGTTVDGLLVPRVSRLRAQTMTGTPTSTVLYVNDVTVGTATGTTVNVTAVGFYFFDGTVWQKLGTGATNAWNVTGNSGLSGTTNFLGTTDAVDLAFRRNNVASGKIGATSTGLGVNALSAGAATNNAAFGTNALALSTGADNAAFGNGTLAVTTTGIQNTGIGNAALALNTGSANTAVGNQALTSNTSASNNTAVGFQALKSNTSSNNTAVGFQALSANTSAAQNTALGFQALMNSNAAYNTAVGFAAMQMNATGTSNTAVGNFALGRNNGTGNTVIGHEAEFGVAGTFNNTTAIGYHALFGNSGSNNTAVGYNALQATSSATGNTAVGNGALNNNTGANNTAVGDSAGFERYGTNNTFVGFQAGRFNPTNPANSNNTFIGSNAGLNSYGSNNTVLGVSALSATAATANNVAIGYNALAVTTGTGNVAIGYNAGAAEAGSNKLYIENSNSDQNAALIYGDFSTDILRVNGTLQVNNPANANGYALPNVRGTSGQVLQTNGAGATSWVTDPATTLSMVNANLTANQVLTNSGWQKINFNNKTFDTASEFTTANGRFTATKAGFYRINAVYHTDVQSNTNMYSIGVWVNGALVKESSADHYNHGIVERSVSCLLQLSVGDYVEIYAENFVNGVNLDSYSGKTYFEIQQVR